jgi:hypothetical protein
MCFVVLQRKRAAVAAEREAAFQQLCSDVLGALEPGSGVLSEATQVLEYAEAAQQARKVALHQQWHTQVFEPIQVSSFFPFFQFHFLSSSGEQLRRRQQQHSWEAGEQLKQHVVDSGSSSSTVGLLYATAAARQAGDRQQHRWGLIRTAA